MQKKKPSISLFDLAASLYARFRLDFRVGSCLRNVQSGKRRELCKLLTTMLNYARDDLGTALGRESISFQSTVSKLNEYRIRSQCHLSEHPKKKHEKRIKLFSLFLMSSKQSIKNGKKEKCLSQCMWRCRQKVFPNKEEIVENLKDGMPIFPIHNLVFFSAMLVLHPNLIWLWTNYCLQLRTNARCKQTRLRSSSLMRCDALGSSSSSSWNIEDYAFLKMYCEYKLGWWCLFNRQH